MSDLLKKINSLTIFKNVRNSEPLKSLALFLEKVDATGVTPAELVRLYSDFVYTLYDRRPDGDLAAAIWDAVIENDNPYLKHTIKLYLDDASAKREISRLMVISFEKELDILTELGSVTYIDLERMVFYDGYVPQFKSSGINIKDRYLEVIANLGKAGFGIYANHLMLRIKDGDILPVVYPDPITVHDLISYERHRRMVIDNTQAFISGKPAQDALLYGDPGTGKSSTVKAVARMFAPDGLRLVELPKQEIDNLADVIDKLSRVPLKFILFLDDVSFDANDDRIGSLKSVIEGSAGGARRNILVYATSNRRHMIRETLSDRHNDIHESDSIAEQMSLSDRFGLRVMFEQPTKEIYLEIVKGILRNKDFSEPDNLESLAEQYALRKGGRSARVAKQFTDILISRLT